MTSIRRHQGPLLLFAGLFLFVTLSVFNLHAEERTIRGKPVLPRESCQTPPQESWTPQEKWVWKQISQGKIADFNKAEGYGGVLDPKEDKEWPDSRILRPGFLETILLHEPYRRALTRHGVRIIGAWFKEPLDLSNALLTHQLCLDASRFESEVDLSCLQALRLLSLRDSMFRGVVKLIGAEIKGPLNINGAKFTSKLEMNWLQVEKSVLMGNGAEFAEVNLSGAKIGGNLEMQSSFFVGNLNMELLNVEGSLLMSKGAKFSGVNLRSAEIRINLEIYGSTITGILFMNYLQVHENIFMCVNAKFAGVILKGAKVGGDLEMYDSTFTGTFSMDSLTVQSRLLMQGADAKTPILLTSGKIGSDLILSGAKLESLDLTGTQVGGALQLASSEHAAIEWQPGAKMVLRNTEVGALQDLPNAWPDALDLDGFTYTRLCGIASNGASDIATRQISWFKKWLEKQKSYSPQPYEQLAGVLRKEGYNDKADDVLYAGRNRELSEATGVLNWLGLFLLKVFIGYGYRTYHAIFWFLGFIALGVFVLRVSRQGPAHGMPYGITYSLDMLLPIIRLHERHYDFDLAGWARYYFYLHILMGYVLGSFLVAGLSGLTK